MKCLLVLCITCFALAGGISIGIYVPNNWPQERLDAQVIQPYVEVRADDGCGAGVYLGNGKALTATHVVKDAARITLFQRSDGGKAIRTWAAAVLKTSGDLALLSVPESNGLTPAKWDSKVAPIRGEECWYMGTPFALHGSLEKSIINKRAFFNKQWNWVTNGHGYYGTSGGPLFVKRAGHYYLVGIVSCGQDDNPKSPVFCIEIGSFLDE